MHHIITDGWSLRVMRRVLTELDDAAGPRRPQSRKLLPIPYANFAAWQRNWLSGEALQLRLDYWKPQGLSVRELPADRSPAAEDA